MLARVDCGYCLYKQLYVNTVGTMLRPARRNPLREYEMARTCAVPQPLAVADRVRCTWKTPGMMLRTMRCWRLETKCGYQSCISNNNKKFWGGNPAGSGWGLVWKEGGRRGEAAQTPGGVVLLLLPLLWNYSNEWQLRLCDGVFKGLCCATAKGRRAGNCCCCCLTASLSSLHCCCPPLYFVLCSPTAAAVEALQLCRSNGIRSRG